MIFYYRDIPSGKSSWSTRPVSSISRSRNKQGKWLRSHFEKSKEKKMLGKPVPADTRMQGSR